jgi:hypothetical protein
MSQVQTAFFDSQPFGSPMAKYAARYMQTFFRKKTKQGLTYFLHSGLEKIPQPKIDHKIGEHMGILLSPIKWISTCKTKDIEKHRQFLKDKAKEEMDIIQDFDVFLDGEMISEHAVRAISDYFEFENYTGIVDGYWLFIRPYHLSLGNHHINAYASCRAGEVVRPSQFNIDIVR